jgi:hypothetical protein
MDFKKNILKWLVLVLFLFLFSCGSREVLKDTSLQENKMEEVIKETETKSVTSEAKIQKLSDITNFNLEPIDGKLAHFVYIVGKDTIKVETNGKLSLNKAKTQQNEILTTDNKQNKVKEAKINQQSKVKTKQTNTKRVNNSFQFILMGMLLVLAIQFLFKYLKNKFIL